MHCLETTRGEVYVFDNEYLFPSGGMELGGLVASFDVTWCSFYSSQIVSLCPYGDDVIIPK